MDGPMRFLLVSDIHGNVAAVRKLRAMETNRFDAVVVAGDIGSKGAGETMGVLASFECPVLYVYGNWDRDLAYGAAFSPDCHHLHLAPFRCGPLAFAGFSGCPSGWGRNPVAETRYRQVTRNQRRSVQGRILAENRRLLGEAIKASPTPPGRTIVVTHERLSRTDVDLSGVPVFLFGHKHRFADTILNGSRFINVAALDMRLVVQPKGTGASEPSQTRTVNVGNYAVMEWTAAGRFEVSCVRLDQPPWDEEWEMVENCAVREVPFLS